MAFYHGVSTRQKDTSIATPVTADSGIPFIVGTAPIHTTEDGKTNDPILCYNYSEAVTALGYSDDWEKYSLCEVIYSQFKLYGVAPIIFVNVLDPSKHKTTADEKSWTVEDGKVLLPLETLINTVQVNSYEEGKDYELFYDEESLVLEILDEGTIPSNAGELMISFQFVDPSKVTENDIVGGFNTSTKQTTGLELKEAIFPRYGIIADLILAPGWSHRPTVAAVMAAKAENINGVFEGKALIDVDTETVRYYTDVTAWKKKNNINSKMQGLCFPKVKLGDRIFHLSTHCAGRMGKTDDENGGCPAESPSNKLLQIDSAVLADGTEILLDLTQANYLNSQGVITCLNWIGGYVLWGNSTACYPADTDVKNYFMCVSRMFGWVANSIVLTYWSRVDKKMTRRLVDTIIDSINIWLNGLVAEEKLLGGRVEFLDEENPVTSLMSGKAVFHVYLTPPSPAQELDFVLEYDVDYVTAAFAS